MARVIFDDVGVTLDAPSGARLMDLADEHPATAVPFSCRFANCGTCRVEVSEGLELCDAPNERELRVRRIFSDPPSVRLACQLQVRGGDGLVRVHVMLRRGLTRRE
ncbi:MAG: 2Fe-2S iron-sulfur cluster-binding protein [Polyangiales bacterium]